MHLLLAALFAAPAHAADLILSWNYEEFPDGDDLSGTDGWSSGYDADPWYGYLSSSSGRTYALPQTDANRSDSPGSWGAGDRQLPGEPGREGGGRRAPHLLLHL